VVLLARSTDGALTAPIAVGFGLAAVAAGAIMGLQRRIVPLFVRLGRRMFGIWSEDSQSGAAISQVELAVAYGGTRRLALGTVLHLLGWFGKGLGNWLAFWLLDAKIDLLGALAIEGLLHAMLAVAILVPGYAGVQEAGYAALGSLFGVPPEVSISVSLLRRARDLAIGIPILLVWQFVEIRRLRPQPPI
jgi:uncharacterized membrane protein YbhN (UPF0104 family)